MEQECNPGVDPRSRCLITEEADEFAALLTTLDRELAPLNAIQRMLVEDLQSVVWEIQRLRRCKAGLINNGFLLALKALLRQFLPRQDYETHLDHEHSADDIARRWFTSKTARTRVRNILRRFRLDETAIEAEAMRLASADLERLDRALMMLEKRRDRLLAQLAVARERSLEAMKAAPDRLIEEQFPCAVTLE